eukprot:9832293-Alexandrium_andersonii.AAC.1
MVLEGLRAEALGERQLREGRLSAHAPLQARLHSGLSVLAHLDRLLTDAPGAPLVVGPLLVRHL